MKFLFFTFPSFTEAHIHNVVLVSGIEQSDSILYIFLRLFSLIAYHKIFNIVQYSYTVGPCYFIYSVYLLITNSYFSPLFPPW